MELSKFGEVSALEMPSEGPGACKVYVKFATAGQSRVARAALQGRKFGANMIDVWFYEPERFESKTWVDMMIVRTRSHHATSRHTTQHDMTSHHITSQHSTPRFC